MSLALVLLTLLTTSREGLISLTLTSLFTSVALLSFMLLRLTFFWPRQRGRLSLVWGLSFGLSSWRRSWQASIRERGYAKIANES